jgi:ribonucleotide monophosphatase NagD (HAD superfamily)
VVAVNLDPFIYDPEGNFPGCGMFVGAISAATGREPDVVVGKPSTLLLEEVLALLGLPASECLFVGDSLHTDVAGARAVGMPSLLVLTGVTDRAALAASPVQPEYVLQSAAELVAQLESAAGEPAARPAGGVRA